MNISLHLWSAVLYTLSLLFLSCVTGLPLVAVMSEAMGKARRKIFMEKFAQQIMRFALVMISATWVALVTQAGIMFRDKAFSHPLVLANQGIALATLGSLALGSIIAAVYYFRWKHFKNHKRLHIALGTMGAIFILTSMLSAALCLRSLILFPDQPILDTLPKIMSLFWPLWLQWACVSVSLVSGLALAYLLTRRKLDDFGRDYYRYVFRLGAKWALWPLLAMIPMCTWIFFLTRSSVDFLYPEILAAASGRGLSLVLAIACWLILVRAESPLQKKWAILLGAVMIPVFLLFSLASFTAILVQHCPELSGQTFVGFWLTH